MRYKTKFDRERVLREMAGLARCPINDAVKLCFLTETDRDEIDQLNLTGLTEFRRSGSGAVELKVTDRLRALESLLAHLEEERGEQGAAFLQALEGASHQRRDDVREG